MFRQSRFLNSPTHLRLPALVQSVWAAHKQGTSPPPTTTTGGLGGKNENDCGAAQSRTRLAQMKPFGGSTESPLDAAFSKLQDVHGVVDYYKQLTTGPTCFTSTLTECAIKHDLYLGHTAFLLADSFTPVLLLPSPLAQSKGLNLDPLAQVRKILAELDPLKAWRFQNGLRMRLFNGLLVDVHFHRQFDSAQDALDELEHAMGLYLPSIFTQHDVLVTPTAAKAVQEGVVKLNTSRPMSHSHASEVELLMHQRFKLELPSSFQAARLDSQRLRGEGADQFVLGDKLLFNYSGVTHVSTQEEVGGKYLMTTEVEVSKVATLKSSADHPEDFEFLTTRSFNSITSHLGPQEQTITQMLQGKEDFLLSWKKNTGAGEHDFHRVGGKVADHIIDSNEPVNITEVAKVYNDVSMGLMESDELNYSVLHKIQTLCPTINLATVLQNTWSQYDDEFKVLQGKLVDLHPSDQRSIPMTKRFQKDVLAATKATLGSLLNQFKKQALERITTTSKSKADGRHTSEKTDLPFSIEGPRTEQYIYPE